MIGISQSFDDHKYIFSKVVERCSRCSLVITHLAEYGRLTTTQSAPSVGSVPTVEEIANVIQAYTHEKGGRVENAEFVANKIHALLTSRTEGK